MLPPRIALQEKKLYAEKTKQTPGPYALAVSGPQPVRCHPVCAGPFVETVRRSVTDTMGRHFVGLANYTAVLGNDAFRLAVENTVRFIGVCVPLLLALSLALALALRAKGLKKIPPGPRSAARPFCCPWLCRWQSLALLWKVLFAQNGLVNGTFGTHCDFMGTDAAFWVLVGTYLWKNIGYDSILWSSGLDSISTDLYEAAAVDGASGWRQFTAITLPNLLPHTGRHAGAESAEHL